MPTEITQKLGFDCSQAIEALTKLDKAMSSAAQSIDRFGKAAQAFNKVGSQVTQLNKTIDNSMRGSAQATDRLSVSFGFLATRILFTQTVVSAFGNFRRTLEGAASDAVDYQKKIAEITTVSDLSQSGAGGLVRNLSDRFNVPLLEEAAGLYQVLSTA